MKDYSGGNCPYCGRFLPAEYPHKKVDGERNPLGIASARNNARSHVAACKRKAERNEGRAQGRG